MMLAVLGRLARMRMYLAGRYERNWCPNSVCLQIGGGVEVEVQKHKARAGDCQGRICSTWRAGAIQLCTATALSHDRQEHVE